MLLYKYAGHSGIKIVEDMRLKVTPPNQLNDPFEVTPRTRVRLTQDYMLEKVKHDPECFRPAYQDMVENEDYSGSFPKFLQESQTLFSKQFREFLKPYRH